MRPSRIYLPNGCSYTVAPIFGGVRFKDIRDDTIENETFLPRGWSIVINTDKPLEDVDDSRHRSPDIVSNVSDDAASGASSPHSTSLSESGGESATRFVKPTLNRDSLFISSLALPPREMSAVAESRTRLLARMLWVTLWWYFHLEEPRPKGDGLGSDGDKGDWRVYIRQEGVLKGRSSLQKLERMGLIASEESSVGLDSNDSWRPAGWSHMFVSRRSFWQIDPRIFLFVLMPGSGYETPSSPLTSWADIPHRPTSSISQKGHSSQAGILAAQYPGNPPSSYYSSSNFPTYFPPPPLQYTTTDGVRHPIRPKPPRQGEVFYNRYIPSLGQTFSFRVPNLTSKATSFLEAGPYRHRKASSVAALPSTSTSTLDNAATDDGTSGKDDVGVLHRWMNNPRVSSTWGMAGPRAIQENFLQNRLRGRHIFPAYGCLDGKPFAYFEIFWMKEDELGRTPPMRPDNWDRGLRCLIGEDDYIGKHRVQAWLSSLVHYCWLADNRTQSVVCHPKATNHNYVEHLSRAGFNKEREIDTPQGRTVIMRINREDWESPTL